MLRRKERGLRGIAAREVKGTSTRKFRSPIFVILTLKSKIA